MPWTSPRAWPPTSSSGAEHRTWIDREDIEKGAGFDVRIEQGIRAADVIAAILTRRSQEETSVCRDEVVFALNEGKPLLPLRLDPAARPTLLLARRNWIDFTGDYEAGLDALLRYLAGDERALRAPRLPTVTGVAPLDFGVEVAKFSADFTGRAWLAAEVDRWLATDKRAFVIVAEPGVGKSAIAAWLSLTRPEVVGVHFCTQQNSRSLNPYEFVACLVGQLHTQLPGFAQAVEAKRPEERRKTAADAFRELLVEPARGLKAPGGTRLIVVDSLDEAATQDGETVLDVLVKQAPDLPPWLRFVTTTRPEAPILQRVRNLNVFELQADRPENRSDVRDFITRRLAAPALHSRVGAAAAQVALKVEELAEGNFLYARLALDALEDGTLPAADLGRLAPDLTSFYDTLFKRRFPDIEAYDQDYAALFRALAVARGPLPFKLLQRISGVSAEVLHRRLLRVRAYLRVFGQGEAASYALFHKSLQDWLTDPDAAGDYWCRAATGHAEIAEVLRADGWGDYALRYLPAHLLGSEQLDRAAGLLCDWQFLEAKAEAGLVFELAGDFAAVGEALPSGDDRGRLLGLLEEAVRRDIHFLARHPTTLFQCLWNSGWWYDCPEAAQHYELSAERTGRGPLPWEREGLKVSVLLQRWRAEKERMRTGFVWLRSLRPPVLRLGTGQKMVLSGHTGPVASVAFSADGKRIVSGSVDQTVRMWDAVSGQCLEVIEGAHDVAAVVAGPASFPWRARYSGLETVIEEAATGRPLAWLPFTYTMTTCPSGRTWAGAVGEYLCLFTLEGVPAKPTG